MIRHGVALCLLLVAGCFETHPKDAQLVRSRDCVTCHTIEYNETADPAGRFPAAPDHTANADDGKPTCSTDCALCHTTDVWTNGLGGCRHKFEKFPLTGTPHANIRCTDCHSEAIGTATGATSTAGMNTDCIACHPNTPTQRDGHVGAVNTNPLSPQLGKAYAYSTEDHRFCLECHPDGLVHGHDDLTINKFKLPHRGATCVKCHDPASPLMHEDGADTLCVSSGCHDGSRDDPAHCSRDPNGTKHHPNCLDAGCHPDGRKHDGQKPNCL